jgi:hypothetical protein
MVGVDKGYDTHDFVDVMRELGVTPHVTQNLTRRGGSAIDARTTRHDGYAKSQHAASNVGGLVVFASAAFNLRRLTTLMAAPA